MTRHSFPSPDSFHSESERDFSGQGEFDRDARPEISQAQWEQLSAFLDGELDLDAAEDVRGWLLEQPQAHQHYRQLRKLQSGFDALALQTTETSPEEMADAVLGRLQKKPMLAIASRQSWMRATQMAATVAVSLLSGGLLWQFNRPTVPMVSLEAPPLDIPGLVEIDVPNSDPQTAQRAQTYLFGQDTAVDPYTILLTDI